MGLLSALAAVFEHADLRAEVGVAIAFGDALPGGPDRLVRQRDRVGSHVGDLPLFIESLGDLHCLAGRHPQFAVRLLLQGAGGEGGVGPAGLFAFLDPGHVPGGGGGAGGEFLEAVAEGGDGRFVEQQHIAARARFRFEPTGGLVEVTALGDALALDGGQFGFEFSAAGGFEADLEVPPGGGAEGPPLELAQDNEPDCHRLHPTGGELGGDLFPEQGGEGVAVEAVEDPAGLLGRDEVVVKLAGVADGLLDRLAGDFGEDHALDRDLGLQDLGEVPANAFAFAVFVGREDEFVGLLEGRFEFADQLLFLGGDDIQGVEPGIDVDPEAGPGEFLDFGGNLGGTFGEVADVPHAGQHLVVAAEIAVDLLRLRGRFNDHQPLVLLLGHVESCFLQDCAIDFRDKVPAFPAPPWAVHLG